MDDLGIEGRETSFLLETFAVIGEWHVRPLTEEGTGEFQGEREPTEEAADGFSLGAFRVLRIIQDGLAGVVTEEQLQGRLLRKDRELHGVIPPEVTLSRREQDGTAQRERTRFRADRP